MRRLGSIQFDPIAVAGRNHDLVLHARVAGYEPAQARRLSRDDLADLRRNAIGGDLAKDLADGTVANFNFIAPNLCHDMHGTPECSDPHALIRDGDKEVAALVDAITGSAMWKSGKNAIIVMWDENDFSNTGDNRVPLIVETNYQSKGMHSSRAYNHFSLLKTMEKGFGLPYLNHANDPQIHAMSDLFALR